MIFVIRSLVLSLILVLVAGNSLAQTPSIKHLNEKHKSYYDSLKNMNYDRVFPIYGDKVYKRGFDIPFPFGIMLNSFYGKQNIDISNIRIGVHSPTKDLGPANMDSIIVFSEVEATILNLNMRADLFIFPFFKCVCTIGLYAKSKNEGGAV